MVYLKPTKWWPLQWCPVLSFYSIKRGSRYKKETQYPLHSMGNICLDFRKRDWWDLNSHSSHTLPCPLLTSYSHVHVHISAHHIYTLIILWCISSTLQFTSILINILQIHHVHVQCSTSYFCSLRSGFLPWPKIFPTASNACALPTTGPTCRVSVCVRACNLSVEPRALSPTLIRL